jgi:hypothetical protein
VLSPWSKSSPTIAQRAPCQLQLLADPDRFAVDGSALELGEAINVLDWRLDLLSPIAHLGGFGIAGVGGPGEAALLRRQRVDLAALVRRGAGVPGEHGNPLGAGDLASDIARNLGVSIR